MAIKIFPKKKIIAWIGLSLIALLTAIVATVCFIFRQLLPLVPLAPQLLGYHSTQTYLILFQNNAELRPGGGFIGSYGLVSFDHGKMGSITVHNVYDADGLLKKHVEPYYIGRRYLQVHLYLHDSNFDVDFAKDAQIAAELLQLDTGQKVDGVVAIDLSFVRSLIDVLSPIYIPEYNETMNANNFFILTETHSDRYSFNGSTQKQDYLAALVRAIKTKLAENKFYYFAMFVEKALEAIPQKHLLFASSNQEIQHVLTKNNFSSTLTDTRKDGPGIINDFFGINEANISINKANYYLKRSINQNVTVDASGTITENVRITYTNTSQQQAWPTGVYKTYTRLILPLHTRLLTITVDGKSQHLVPAVTDFRIYEAPEFKPPSGLELDNMQEEGKELYGFITTVGIKTTKTVTISYRLPSKVTFVNGHADYSLILFKQPGMNNDPYVFALTYPKQFYATVTGTIADVKKTQGNVFLSTHLSTDQQIQVNISHNSQE